MAKLILITLPIGNMDDLSPRSAAALRDGSHFFVEDTRVFKDRVKRAGIELNAQSLYAFHDQDRSKVEKALEILENGEDIYMASDAGSPLISDPAFPMVREVLMAGYELDTLPGPNAVVTALELSGLPPHPFHFHGFLPKETERKRKAFERCSSIEGTHIFFESPHRVLETTHCLCETLDEIDICLAKELTKTYQNVYRFNSKDWDNIKSEVIEKGEFVLLFHVKEGVKASSAKLVKMAKDVLDRPDNKKLSKLLSEILGRNAKELYTELGKNSKNPD